MRLFIRFMSVLVLIILSYSGSWAAEFDTIPPEVLKQYDQEIVSGKRPIIAKMAQGDIFSLRTNPVFKADFVQFSFNPNDLSKVQTDILMDWLEGGYNNVMLIGKDRETYAQLCGFTTTTIFKRAAASEMVKIKLSIDNRHPTSVDVADVFSQLDSRHSARNGRLLTALSGIKDDRTPGFSIAARNSDGSAAVGMFLLKNTKVYFMPLGYTGPDAERFRLNFLHWALGINIPESAVSATNEGPVLTLAATSTYDIIELRNGDTITGHINNETFNIKTSYASLTFQRDRVQMIQIESSETKLDVLTLRVGDKMSGTLEDKEVRITLVSGSEIVLQKNKIMTIRMKKAPNK